jgi:hypothetical protein
MLGRSFARLATLIVTAFWFVAAALEAQQATVTIDIKAAIKRARSYSPRF